MLYYNESIRKIKIWLKDYNITNYRINDNLSVDLYQSYDCKAQGCDKLALDNIPFVFNCVHGSFNCYGLGIESLYFSPKIVTGIFDCSNNKLTSLKGCPEKVLGNFYCYDNQLISLKYSPEIVLGSFWCKGNPSLKSLEGINLKGIKGKLIVTEHLRNDPIYKKYLLREKIRELC